MESSFRERERDVDIIAEADVVVAGGGPAGVAAAVSAARQGVRVVLIERYGCLGGMATGGLVIQLDNYCNGEQIIVKGLGEELWKRLDRLNAAYVPPWFRRKNVLFDPEAFKWIAQEMVQEAGVEVILHAWVVDVVCKDGNIQGVIIESKSGRQAIRGRVFVDGTGDADLACWAGAPFETGLHRIGVVSRAANVDYEAFREWLKATADTAEGKRVRAEIAERGLLGPHASWRNDVVWFNSGVSADALDVRDLTRVELDIRRKIHETITFYRDNVPAFKDAYLLDTASQVGTRESRRILGPYVLTMDDLAGSRFEDCIGRGNRWDKDGDVFDIPYRCLLPQHVDNLVVAGRCISVTHDAHNITRTIPLCMVTGQAAGVAAAMAAKEAMPPSQVDIGDLQKTLKAQGANLG